MLPVVAATAKHKREVCLQLLNSIAITLYTYIILIQPDGQLSTVNMHPKQFTATVAILFTGWF